MAKITIRGDQNPTIVTDEKALQISELKNRYTQGSIKGTYQVDCDGRFVEIKNIKEIIFSTDENRDHKLDLSQLADRESVKQFERDLDDFRFTETISDPSYYGTVINSKLVSNPVLGYVPPYVVAFALKQRVITRQENFGRVYFAIAPDRYESGGIIDVTGYLKFKAKYSALGELRARRAYMEKATKPPV